MKNYKFMRIMKIFIIIAVVILCAALTSCDDFAAFDILPDADLGDAYFDHLIEHQTQYENIYSYLIIRHIIDIDGPGAQALREQYRDGYYALFAASYRTWQERHPDKLEIIRGNIPTLYRMVRRITSRNQMHHFEAMQNTIASYVSALYINSPAPPMVRIVTDEDGTEREEIVPQIDLEYARANFESFVCPDFLSMNPQGAVAAYLNEHNINVKRIQFEDFISIFEHRAYPFRVTQRFRIFYYIGNEPVEETRWRDRWVTAVYYLGIDANGNYIIRYVNDPRVAREIINSEYPQPADFELEE